ncbi:hypothetical protein VP01_3285g2, partial [Puccinia sorghi]
SKQRWPLTYMPENISDEIKPSQNTSSLKTTNYSSSMDKIDLIYLILAIDAIPTLTQENYSIWHTQILHYLDRLLLKEFFVDCKGIIKTTNAQNVWTVLTSKMDAMVHANSIKKYFALQHAANRARVWNNFSYLDFDSSDVLGFFTKTKAALKQLHEVVINRDPDILAFEIVKKLPKTPEFTGISTAITHSGAAITPDLVPDHLRLHANQPFIERYSSDTSLTQKQVSLFTDASRKCKYKAHHTLANHPEFCCWKLYLHL